MKETSILRTILTALISIAVTVIGGLLLYYFQSKQPELIYKVDKILPFESQTQKLNIYHITIENTGNQIAEDVVCQIQITPATVKEYRVNSDAPIQIIDSVKKQDIDINTSSLNPKESYKVSITFFCCWGRQVFWRPKKHKMQQSTEVEEEHQLQSSFTQILRKVNKESR